MAPMFLVSNTKMIIAALENGITGAIPALNYRTDTELREAISEIKKASNKPFGINLITNRSNPKFEKQLQTCIEMQVSFIITSLGSPEKTIRACNPNGIKVFADVTTLEYAKKVEDMGADAVIAVNAEAGGHSGDIKGEEFIPLLVKNCKIPVISAGGVATNAQLNKMISLGAVAVSVGTIFIASEESPVSKEYKQALIDYSAKDIIRTTRLSGSPCTVINTPYLQKIGTKPSFLEKLLKRNKRFKRFIKAIIFLRGMKAFEKAAYTATYKTVWCAGPTIDYVQKVRPAKEIIRDLVSSLA